MYKHFGEKGAYDKNNTSLLQPHGKRKQNSTFKSDKDSRYPERDTLIAIYLFHSVLESRKNINNNHITFLQI